MNKKIIVYIVILALFLTSCIAVWADIQDYRDIPFYNSNNEDIYKPTAQFSVTHKGTTYKSPIGTDIDSNIMKITANVGDTVTVADLSRSNMGKILKAWDFQYTRPDGNNQFITTQAFQKSYTLDAVGTYTFSLCVRDTVENEAWTYYWGNWSDNGNHRVVGNNPGRDAGDPSDDFNGYWYFTRIVVNVVNNPPTADFKIQYNGEDVTDNKTNPVTVNSTDKALVLKDYSKPFSAAEPITGRKWYYWNTSSGWSEIAGSENKTTVNITDMDTTLPGSAVNKAFKLVCTSSAGGSNYAEHTGYFKKGLATTYGYIIYYKNVDTDLDISTPKVVEGLTTGTYSETAKAAPANSTLVTSSPQTITLSAAAPKAEFTFYYKFTETPEPPASKPPTALIEAPAEVMAGQPVKANGGKSWSNNPGGYITDYNFEYEGANLIKDNGSNVNIWYPVEGTYEVYLDVEDENGRSDSDEQEIKVTPPIPKAAITVTGKLKENRKVTISSTSSTSPEFYPINKSTITWTITPISGGTATDIKYNGVLNGNETKDLLFKKAGTYRIKLNFYNTAGRNATAEQTITIAADLPPVAKMQLPVPDGEEYIIYRDPNDNNNATAQFFNISYSPDGDTIGKAVGLYCYDSDNDGDYKDEQWYYSADGVTWTSTGMNYADTASKFNVYSIGKSNIQTFTEKSKEVGKYHYAINVMEDILASETIPEFIKASDYRWDNDF